MVIVHENERGAGSIVGQEGRFYANTVGAFGAVSARGDWGRLASAAHRWDLKLVENNDFFLLFSGDALELEECEIADESPLVVIILLMILR